MSCFYCFIVLYFFMSLPSAERERLGPLDVYRQVPRKEQGGCYGPTEKVSEFLLERLPCHETIPMKKCQWTHG